MTEAELQALFRQALERQQRGDWDGAAAIYSQILTRQPASLPVLANLGFVFYQQGRFEEALNQYDNALALSPGSPDLLLYQAFSLRELERPLDALAAFDRAIARGQTEGWTGRGVVLQKLRRFDEALESYHRALALEPRNAEALNNSGVIHCELGDPMTALAALDAALRLAPDSWQTHNNRGNALRDLGQPDAALESYDAALVRKPDYADAYYNRGDVLMSMRRYQDAAGAYADAAAAQPDLPCVQGALLNARMQLCDWQGYVKSCALLLDQVDRGLPATTPFPLLLVVSSPRQQRRAAELYIARRLVTAAEPPPPHRNRRIRVGFVSATFRHHPVMLLAIELFERIDRTRFESFAFSLAPGDDSVMRTRLESAFDHFIDAAALDDRGAAEAIRGHNIDIAIDLDGFTQDARLGVLAHRPALVQMSWLGYPGTIGAPFIDYILADAHVIPPGAEAGYREHVLRLPFSYQPNSARPEVAPALRAQAGLPESGFVFCCFNNPSKITPDVFAVWMRLLAATPASILWLRVDDATAQANLRAATRAAGIDAVRLIFAPQVSEADHFARLAASDLFLDTFPYNAHTTASDALWAGVPVVTRRGETFVSRVAASLLQAVDLSELITTSERDYEALALELAHTPDRLMVSRRKLTKTRATAPLFDMARFTCDFETMLEGLCGR
ncbi:MAG TPA: tetratricopeptide repeat protein [Rhizomicrobium sp.]|jgi:predicted O-linked N-acetylglucosamine transferase (SPINDLY family)